MSKKNTSTTTPRTKVQLLLRDGNNCLFCKKSITKSSDLTIDHIVPLIKGGTNHHNNLALCCSNCNAEKGRLLLTEFIRAKELVMTRELARFL